MTYSRSCGVSLAACGASECRCVPAEDAEPPEIATKFGYNENAPAGAGNTPRGLTRSSDSTREGLT